MDDWVKKTFEKDVFGCSDYCLNCGCFVAHPGQCPKDHIIVRKQLRDK